MYAEMCPNLAHYVNRIAVEVRWGQSESGWRFFFVYCLELVQTLLKHSNQALL